MNSNRLRKVLHYRLCKMSTYYYPWQYIPLVLLRLINVNIDSSSYLIRDVKKVTRNLTMKIENYNLHF